MKRERAREPRAGANGRTWGLRSTSPRKKRRQKKGKRTEMISGSTSGRGRSSLTPGDTGAQLPVNDSLYSVVALSRFPELLHGISTRRAPDGADWNLSSKRGSPQH